MNKFRTIELFREGQKLSDQRPKQMHVKDVAKHVGMTERQCKYFIMITLGKVAALIKE